MSTRKKARLMWLPRWRVPRDILAERIRDDAQARTKLPWAQRAYEILTILRQVSSGLSAFRVGRRSGHSRHTFKTCRRDKCRHRDG